MDRYLLTASIRRDGSSVFGANHKWGNFGSGALRWKIAREDFMKDQKIFNSLDFRVGYGVTGNQGVGPYQTLSKLIPYSYTFNGSLANGYADDYYAGPGNAGLKWETTDQYDAGLDLAFLKPM